MSAPKITYRQYGGKASIAKWIVSQFPPHRVYCEPFCGGASVLFAKEPSFSEIINDLDHRIISMFEQIRSRPFELAAQLWATPHAQANWREHAFMNAALEDARLLMAQGAQFYCGSGRSSTWAVDVCSAKHKPKQSVWADWFRRILPAAVRIREVTILCEDALKTIARVADDPQCLIYVDPPYFGHEDEYRFSVDYKAMVCACVEAKAMVVVSEYPEAADFFPGWHCLTKETAGRARTGAHNCPAKKKTECLFLNDAAYDAAVGREGGK